MAFTLCKNDGCPYAMWCRRFTYKISYPEVLQLPDSYPIKYFECTHGEYYVMNKNREIYERDYNESIYDEFKQEEYRNSNRESGMREDDIPCEQNDGTAEEGNRTESVSVPFFFERSGGRGSGEDPESDQPGQGGQAHPAEFALFQDDTLHMLFSAWTDIRPADVGTRANDVLQTGESTIEHSNPTNDNGESTT